jgi:PTH1 family peptidyl-tRNA hydrolase
MQVMGENSQAWFLIVGLGNPGHKYQRNRHNVGFQCLDRLAQAHQLVFDKKQDKAEVAMGRIGGHRVILAKPQSFVNCSGEAVGALARFFKIEPDHILVIYDDLDLEQGIIRVRPKGSAGGHNGIKSIIEHLGTQDFPRIRVGIGRPPGKMEPKSYVLQDFGSEELELMEEVCGRVLDALGAFLDNGVPDAMNRFNVRPRSEGSEADE